MRFQVIEISLEWCRFKVHLLLRVELGINTYQHFGQKSRKALSRLSRGLIPF